MSYKKPQKNLKPEYLSYNHAMVVFGMGADAIKEMAIECGAFLQRGRSVLINYAKFKEYLDTFVVSRD